MRKDNTSILSNGTSCGSNWKSDPVFGYWFNGPTYGFRGHFTDVNMYSDVKGSTDRGLVDTYLADRISGAWYAAENP